MKLMILGHGRHGKDTACEILRDNHNLTFRSSSEAACELVVYPALKASHGYATIEECYNDRHNHRELWHHLIWQHNRQDHANLARAIYAENDVYCGMRHITELKATRTAGLFDYAIWVDRSQHQPAEPASSCSVTRTDADYVLDNNGTLEELAENIDRMMGKLYSDMLRKQKHDGEWDNVHGWVCSVCGEPQNTWTGPCEGEAA